MRGEYFCKPLYLCVHYLSAVCVCICVHLCLCARFKHLFVFVLDMYTRIHGVLIKESPWPKVKQIVRYCSASRFNGRMSVLWRWYFITWYSIMTIILALTGQRNSVTSGNSLFFCRPYEAYSINIIQWYLMCVCVCVSSDEGAELLGAQ